MELRVLFFTICCSVVCATVYRSVVYATIYVQERLRNGGRLVSLRPLNKRRYLKGVEELRKFIDEFSDKWKSMKICINQCQYLRLECLRLVQPSPPDSILKESLCAIRRALKLMEDCCSANWILKAVEFGNCHNHFLEILLDLHRLSIVVDRICLEGESLGVMAECKRTDISDETKSKIDGLYRRACELDTAALRCKLVSEMRHDYPDNCLADQLKEDLSSAQLDEDSSSTQLKEAPRDIGRHVTEFDMLKSEFIHNDTSSGICVFPVIFCDKKFVIKMRLSRHEVQEDIQLQNEAFYMKKCRHPYAVALLGFWKATRTDRPRVPLLLMESMECDLHSIIPRNKWRWWWGGTGGFPALDAINLVLPVAKVMKYLHEIGVVHLDLKPKNILFTRVPGTQDLPEDVSVKLADFGEARWSKDGVIGRVGTCGYMDPDVWDRKVGVNLVKADVFSFGMVFGEVLTGLEPKEALGKKLYFREFYENLQKGKQVPLPKETPEFVKSIVESCLKLNPNERPSFDVICQDLRKAVLLLNGYT